MVKFNNVSQRLPGPIAGAARTRQKRPGKEGPSVSKLSVGGIFGGASSEYEISLRSAASVIGQMKEELYDNEKNSDAKLRWD